MGLAHLMYLPALWWDLWGCWHHLLTLTSFSVWAVVHVSCIYLWLISLMLSVIPWVPCINCIFISGQKAFIAVQKSLYFLLVCLFLCSLDWPLYVHIHNSQMTCFAWLLPSNEEYVGDGCKRMQTLHNVWPSGYNRALCLVVVSASKYKDVWQPENGNLWAFVWSLVTGGLFREFLLAMVLAHIRGCCCGGTFITRQHYGDDEKVCAYTWPVPKDF